MMRKEGGHGKVEKPFLAGEEGRSGGGQSQQWQGAAYGGQAAICIGVDGKKIKTKS